MTRLLKLTAICFFTLSAPIAHANTDVVVFLNGDRLTGELKSLERGLLRFKTDATNTIRIEWDKVAYVSSDQNVQVETEEGLRFLGSLSWPPRSGEIVVETISGAFELDANRIVKLTPIKETVTGRFDGQLALGYNFTKASKVKQLNVGLDLDYRTELRIFSLDLDAVTSDTGDTEASQRNNLNFTYRRLRANRWVNTGLFRLTRNDELGLDMRTSVGGGIGRIMRQSSSSALLLEGGVTINKENNAGGVEGENTWELYSSVNWDWWRYDLPELDLSADWQLFPSLSESGRLRSEFDITFRWEFIDDFFWSLSYYNSYDSRPKDPSASKTDYGVNTSVAWDF